MRPAFVDFFYFYFVLFYLCLLTAKSEENRLYYMCCYKLQTKNQEKNGRSIFNPAHRFSFYLLSLEDPSASFYRLRSVLYETSLGLAVGFFLLLVTCDQMKSDVDPMITS